MSNLNQKTNAENKFSFMSEFYSVFFNEIFTILHLICAGFLCR